MTSKILAANAPGRQRSRRIKWGIRILVPVVLVGAMIYFFGGDEGAQLSEGTTFTVTRGPLEIVVLEGGSIESEESEEIKSEVEGQTKILTLVEEGITVTPEDVSAGKVLVELDSKELQDKLVEEKLQYQNALATFTEAKEQYGIQVNQNESDIKAAELEVKFARMDLEKYLGVQLAQEVVGQIQSRPVAVTTPVEASSEAERVQAATAPPQPEGAVPVPETVAKVAPEPGQDAPASPIEVESTFISRPEIDFTQYADPKLLGDGEARQKLRTLENEVVLTEEEVGLANSQLEGTQRLFEKDFVTKTDLDNDSMKLKRSSISQEAAETSQNLFIRYEFPKEAEKLLSAYEEALRKLERAKRTAISKLAQAEAQLNSAQARYELQSRKLEELQEQIAKCTMRATKPGLVVYGGDEDSRWYGEDRIKEGAQVRERQVIITIPDTSRMIANVKVHESYVKRVKKSQKARIRVDANPDLELKGEVKQIGVLPDSQNRWMNPDLKVYKTEITIEGVHDWLKPGMSAEVEIIIDTIPDAVQIPLTSVQVIDGKQVVYVSGLTGPEERPVETGSFNDSRIEVLKGLEPGEVVVLRMPKKGGEAAADEDKQKEEEKPAENGEQAGPPPVAWWRGGASEVVT